MIVEDLQGKPPSVKSIKQSLIYVYLCTKDMQRTFVTLIVWLSDATHILSSCVRSRWFCETVEGGDGVGVAGEGQLCVLEAFAHHMILLQRHLSPCLSFPFIAF